MTLSNPAQYISGRTVQEQMNSLIDYVDQRAADVALDAIASDVAQVHQDMLDADADASAAAASAAAAAGTLANAVKKTGEASQSIEGDVSLSTGDLSVAGDAAVQGQLSVIGGCDLRAPVKVPTVATGTFDDNAANGNKVKNELDNYAPMVRTTGNQTKAGTLTLTSGIVIKAYQAETIEMAGGPKIGTNPTATQSIMRLYKNADDTEYVTRDTLYQAANSRTVSRLWYLQRQNASGDGVETVTLTLGFGADGRATLTLSDSQGTRVIM